MDNGLSLETEQAIYAICDEWWSSHTPRKLVGFAEEMCKYGMPEDEAVELLTNMYYTVANEYGD
jgi:hypothetical protein